VPIPTCWSGRDDRRGTSTGRSGPGVPATASSLLDDGGALHSGYCLRRHYMTFTGTQNGKHVRRFLEGLVARRLAVRLTYRPDRGHVYHLHHVSLSSSQPRRESQPWPRRGRAHRPQADAVGCGFVGTGRGVDRYRGGQGCALHRAVPRWLEDGVKPRCRPRTYAHYRQQIDSHIVPTVGNVPLARLTPQDIQRRLIAAKLEQGLSGRTATRPCNPQIKSRLMRVKAPKN